MIKEIRSKGFDLSPSNFRSGANQALELFIQEKFSEFTSAYHFYMAALRKYHSWPAVLREAGFTPGEFMEINRYSDVNPPRIIRALHAQGWDMSKDTFLKKEDPEFVAAFQEIVGKWSDPKAFQRHANDSYEGGWEGALTEAGLDPAHYRTVDVCRDADFPDIIKRMHARKYPLNFSAFEKVDEESPMAAFLRITISPHATPRQFREAAQKKYGGKWDNALKAAGLNPLEIRQGGILDRVDFIEYVKGLHADGFDLSFSGLHASRADSPRLWARIQSLSTTITPRAVYSHGRHKFGTWDDCLRAAGLNPVHIRHSNKYVNADIPKILQELNAAGHSLNPHAFSQNPAVLTYLIKNATLKT